MKKKIKKIKKTAGRKKAGKSARTAKAKGKTKTKAKPKANKPIGTVAHFYNHIGVAIVKFNAKIAAGTKLHFKGATTDFMDTPKSMQFNHIEIKAAPKGKQVGVKVKKRVREGDLVYRSE